MIKFYDKKIHWIKNFIKTIAYLILINLTNASRSLKDENPANFAFMPSLSPRDSIDKNREEKKPFIQPIKIYSEPNSRNNSRSSSVDSKRGSRPVTPRKSTKTTPIPVSTPKRKGNLTPNHLFSFPMSLSSPPPRANSASSLRRLKEPDPKKPQIELGVEFVEPNSRNNSRSSSLDSKRGSRPVTPRKSTKTTPIPVSTPKRKGNLTPNHLFSFPMSLSSPPPRANSASSLRRSKEPDPKNPQIELGVEFVEQISLEKESDGQETLSMANKAREQLSKQLFPEPNNSRSSSLDSKRGSRPVTPRKSTKTTPIPVSTPKRKGPNHLFSFPMSLSSPPPRANSASSLRRSKEPDPKNPQIELGVEFVEQISLENESDGQETLSMPNKAREQLSKQLFPEPVSPISISSSPKTSLFQRKYIDAKLLYQLMWDYCAEGEIEKVRQCILEFERYDETHMLIDFLNSLENLEEDVKSPMSEVIYNMINVVLKNQCPEQNIEKILKIILPQTSNPARLTSMLRSCKKSASKRDSLIKMINRFIQINEKYTSSKKRNSSTPTSSRF